MGASGTGIVVRFPAFRTPSELPPAHSGTGPGAVAFLDMAGMDQDGFSALLAAARVTAVIDARRVAVFEKPRFRHKEVVLDLYRRGIPYIEMMMLAVFPVSERRLGTFRTAEATARFEDALARGLTLCIHDADAREHGWLEETRRLLRLSRGYAFEVHPRALPGMVPVTKAHG